MPTVVPWQKYEMSAGLTPWPIKRLDTLQDGARGIIDRRRGQSGDRHHAGVLVEVDEIRECSAGPPLTR